MGNTEYISQAEFARRNNVTRQAVNKAIVEGRLEVNEHRRVRADAVIDNAFNPPDSAGDSIGGVINSKDLDAMLESGTGDPRVLLALARLQKLQVDTVLQNQKIEANRKKLLDDLCEKIFSAYELAFAPLKNSIIRLRLDKEQAAELSHIITSCVSEFGSALENIDEYIENAEND